MLLLINKSLFSAGNLLTTSVIAVAFISEDSWEGAVKQVGFGRWIKAAAAAAAAAAAMAVTASMAAAQVPEPGKEVREIRVDVSNGQPAISPELAKLLEKCGIDIASMRGGSPAPSGDGERRAIVCNPGAPPEKKPDNGSGK